MVPMKFYKLTVSPAVRSVLITANALNITFEEHEVDVLNGEHMSPKYLKLNPLHTVPTLDDNGRILCDSHVINTYLVGKCARDDSLYPKDLYKRALVDQKLAFDLGTLYPLLLEIDRAYYKKEITALTPKMVADLKVTYDFLETMLKGKDWVSLDHVTIADFSCYTTMSCLDYHKSIHSNEYPNIRKWFERCRDHPLFSKDVEACALFPTLMKSFMA